MSAPTPPPIPPPPNRPAMMNYRPPPPVPGAGKKFVLGLLAGTAVSLLVWFTVFSKWAMNSQVAPAVAVVMLTILLAKYIGAIVAVCFRQHRMIGAGLFTSAALGVIIMFGRCFASL